MWSVRLLCYMPETRLLECVCQAVSQPWDRAVHGGRPAFRELTAGVGADSAHMYTSLHFTACALMEGEEGTVVSFPLYFPHLTCASQLMMVQFLQWMS